MSDNSQLSNIINTVRLRRRTLAIFKGTAVTIAFAAGMLLLIAFAAYRFRYHNGTLIGLRFAAIAGLIASVYFFLIRPLRQKLSDLKIARLIEEKHTGLQDRLATAVEFEDRKSQPVIARLLEDANQKVSEVNADEIVPRKRLFGYGGLAAAAVALFVGAILFGPKELTSGLTNLVKPVSAASLLNPTAPRIEVKPGTARVPKGSDQKFTAKLINFTEEKPVTFYYRKAGTDDQWIGQPMEAAKNKNEFQYFIFNIQDTIEYFVESETVKSETFKMDVVDLPYVSRLDITLNYPAYTGMPTKTEEDSGDIAALAGTVASIKAFVSKQAKAAFIVMKDGRKIAMTPGEQKIEDGSVEHFFTGGLTVAGNSSYHIELVSVDGETYNGSNEHDITVLEDEPPTVTFEKPGRDTKATSIEEIFTSAKAEDDYGVASMELVFSVNGGEEKKVPLQNLQRETAKTLTGAHTFFIEEYGLKPGDFISYYAKARDAQHETTSDIYFIEIKPFEKEFRQSQQAGGGQGQAGEQEQALPKRQKDIIAATFRIVREEPKYSAADKTENYNTVTLAQEKLREDALGLIERIKRRIAGMTQGAEKFNELIGNISQATKEMEGAAAELKAQHANLALPFEQRSLQQLLRADAIFREIQVNMSQAQGQGQGQQQQSEELADLFELELDKMKNQYETLNREQKQQGQQQDDQTKNKLEELARRQQKELEQQQRKGQQARNQQGGGGGGSRQQQELIEEAKKQARELEKLSRERRDPQMQRAADQLKQAAEEMQKAQNAQQNGNAQEAQTQMQRVMEKLQQASQQVNNNQKGQSGNSVQDLKNRAANAASQQQDIQKKLDDLQRKGNDPASQQSAQESRQNLMDKKNELANQVGNIERELDQTARGMSGEQQKAADQLREAASGLRRNQVTNRIRRNNQNIAGNQMEAAREGEKVIQQNLNELVNQLQSAEQSAKQGAKAQTGKGGDAEATLEKTRQLADNLESLRKRLQNKGQGQGNQESQQGQGQKPGQQQQGQQGQGQQQARNGQPGQGQQPGQQPGQQSGQQNPRGQQQGQQGQGQQPGQGQGQQQARNNQPGQRGQQGQGQQPGQQGQGQQGQQGQGQQGQGQQGQGQQGQGQQGQGQGQGQQGQRGQGQGQGQQNGGQSGGGGQRQGGQYNPSGMPGGGGVPMGGDRQTGAELRERMREAQDLRQQLARQGKGGELTAGLDKAIREMQQMMNQQLGDDNATAQRLKAEVIEPLRQIEVELSKRLQLKQGAGNLRLADEGAAPERYRRLVDEYYKKLSKRNSLMPDGK